MSQGRSAGTDVPLQAGPRATATGFGQDCTVGEKLQLRCFWQAVGEYLYARRGARQMLALRHQLIKSNPELGRADVMVRIAIIWFGTTEAESRELLQRAQDSFGEWPSSHEMSFRNFVVYLLVTKYLQIKCSSGTQLDFPRLVAKWIPD